MRPRRPHSGVCHFPPESWKVHGEIRWLWSGHPSFLEEGTLGSGNLVDKDGQACLLKGQGGSVPSVPGEELEGWGWEGPSVRIVQGPENHAVC